MHTDAGDAIGIANTWMFEGDWSAAPGSSPETLGLVLADGATSVAAPEPDYGKAMHAYLQAAQALAGSDARSATAAVDLRLAFLAGRSGNFETQREQLALSERGYREVGDAAGTHLVTVHRWLADLARGDFIAGAPRRAARMGQGTRSRRRDCGVGCNARKPHLLHRSGTAAPA